LLVSERRSRVGADGSTDGTTTQTQGMVDEMLVNVRHFVSVIVYLYCEQLFVYGVLKGVVVCVRSFV
jgi:hypothetical protein